MRTMIIHVRTKETPASLGARSSQGVCNRGARKRKSHAEDAGTSPRGLFGKDVTWYVKCRFNDLLPAGIARTLVKVVG